MASYYPKMNGTVEAANKNIKEIVAKMTKLYKDWSEKLLFAMAVNKMTTRMSDWGNAIFIGIQNGRSGAHRAEIPSFNILKEVKIRRGYEQLSLIEEKKISSTSSWSALL